MRFRTVLFDLDGTLVDHLPAIHRSYVHTLPQLGHPAPTMEQVRRAIGGGLRRAMRQFVSDAELSKALEIYRVYWDKTMLDDVALMPGANDLLKNLQAAGCQLAVYTNKHGPSSRAICQHLNITPYFAGIWGAEDLPWLKSDPRFAAHVLKELRADVTTTCLVGDSPFDAEAARNGGFECFIVATGTHSADELRAAGVKNIFPNLTVLGHEVFGVGAKS
jgi:phosphoglycolate phosphatase